MVKNIKNSSKHDFYTCFLLRYFQKYTADNINLILSSKVNTSPIIAPLQQWQLQILAEKKQMFPIYRDIFFRDSFINPYHKKVPEA